MQIPPGVTRESGKTKRAPAMVAALVECYGGREVELDWTTPFELLIATILSAQSTDKKTNEVTAELFAKYPDPAAYLAVDPVRPPRNRIPTVSEGRPWLVAKMAFERTYLAFARRGKLVPTSLGW